MKLQRNYRSSENNPLCETTKHQIVCKRDKMIRLRVPKSGSPIIIYRKRPRKRPKKRWIDGIKQDLEKLEIPNWEEKLHNRKRSKEVSVVTKTFEGL